MPAPHEPLPPHRGADKRAILRDHYLFGKLSPQHIDRLSTCIVTKTVKRGTIFAAGDPDTSLCAIGAGTVRISVRSVHGKDAVRNVLGKGAIGDHLDDAPVRRDFGGKGAILIEIREPKWSSPPQNSGRNMISGKQRK